MKNFKKLTKKINKSIAVIMDLNNDGQKRVKRTIDTKRKLIKIEN